jgi:hypothetical protein
MVVRQGSAWERNGSPDTFVSLEGSGLSKLSVAPIRMIWSMCISGWVMMQVAAIAVVVVRIGD